MMKTLRYMTALCAVLMLAACGGGDGGGGSDPYTPEPYSPKTSSAELKVGYEGLTQTASIDVFTSDIIAITGVTDWFHLTKQTYTSGVPTVNIVVDENVTLSERKTNVTLTSKLGDRLIINVTQEAHPAETNTGGDSSHDNVSDQPAYAPGR
ncbi:MAG: hypothetical protein K5778_00560 [Bacteroidaceae bacterium]|nr:hypothetical protein [Bacteroidaceae bacterium]